MRLSLLQVQVVKINVIVMTRRFCLSMTIQFNHRCQPAEVEVSAVKNYTVDPTNHNIPRIRTDATNFLAG